jgi:hypothetical protein
MRNVIVVNQQFADPYNVQMGFVEVYWIPVVNVTMQQPLSPSFQSAVPAQATAVAGSVWATVGVGASPAEIAAIQLGQVREFPIPIPIPLPCFTDAGALATVDAMYRALYARVNGGTSTVAPAVLPSSVSYIGASAVTQTTTVAAGSNGAALPQGTINVASTANFTATGVIFVPATQTSGPQVGQIVPQQITYTGLTGTSFTGCTGGAGTMFLGGAVNQHAFTPG